MKRKQQYLVAGGIRMSGGWSEQLLRGLSENVSQAEGGELRVVKTEEVLDLVRKPPSDVQVCGVVGFFYEKDHHWLGEVVTRRVPVVCLSAERPPSGVHWVHNHDETCGRWAAEHFLDQGLPNFAVLGMQSAFSQKRAQGFLQMIAEAAETRDDISAQVRVFDKCFKVPECELVEWLKSLPTPTGLYACNDFLGSLALRLCLRESRWVPEEVSIVGTDDDDFLCHAGGIPMSSVQPNWRRMGARAATILRVAGAEQEALEQRIHPVGVKMRQSSDFFAFVDADVVRALRFIRSTDLATVKVADIVEASKLGQRTLERRFQESVRHSIHEAVQRERLRRALELLNGKDNTPERIAEVCGFGHLEAFEKAFSERFGFSPADARRELQVAS